MALLINIFFISLYLCLAYSQVEKVLPIICLLNCEFGREVDASGRILCKCFDPCKKLPCPPGKHCERIDNLYCPAINFCPLYAYGCVKDCIECTLKCPYGYKTINGKKICQCYWPCEESPCPQNTICQPYEVQCFVAPCPWHVKCIPKYNSCNCGGDPHCYTFDNAGMWDNQITCEYVAAMVTGSNYPSFTILSKNFKYNPSDAVAYVEYVKIYFAGDVIVLKMILPSTLIQAEVNSFSVTPFYFFNSQYTITGNNVQLIFLSTNGIRVTFSQYYFNIELPYIYFNLTKGWCGNFDGNASNDKYDKTNYAVLTPDRFNMGYLAESWVYDPILLGTDRCKTVPSTNPTCTLPVTKCDFIFKAPFDKCTASMDTAYIKSFYESCVYDIQQTCSDTEGCNVLARLAAICAQNGFIISWRSATDCPCKCADPNAECRTDPSSACVPRCSAQKCRLAVDEKRNLVDVCLCKSGFYLFNGICVLQEQCGCVDENGRLREIGASWLSNDCLTKYTCNAGGRISSVDNTCSRFTFCKYGVCQIEIFNPPIRLPIGILQKRKKYRLRLCVDTTALRSWIVH